ncbi:replication factor A2 [Tirmania nivea]|nr:replication factor A2 [Tirmania nivea]
MSGYQSYGGNDYSYTGGGAGGGGGWMAGTQGGSQASPGSASKDKNHTHTLRPVTIKQLLEAQPAPHKEGEWKIDDHDLHHITICGQIRNIAEQATSLTYRLDDGTGVIEAKQWVDPENPHAHEARTKLVDNMYVRVLGQLRTVMNSQRKYIAAASAIRPIEFNEVMYHALEATAVHLHFTRGPKEQFENVAGIKGDIQMSGMGAPPAYSSVAKLTEPMSANNPAFAILSPTSRRIMAFLSTVDAEGVHVNVIAQKTGLAVNEVYKVKEELTGNGFAFQTVDDETLAPMTGSY